MKENKTDPNLEWQKAFASLLEWRTLQRFQKADNPNIIATFVNGPQHNLDIGLPRNCSPVYYFPLYKERDQDWWTTDIKEISPTKNKVSCYRKVAEGLTYAIFMYMEEK